jgi:hypothetical protein
MTGAGYYLAPAAGPLGNSGAGNRSDEDIAGPHVMANFVVKPGLQQLVRDEVSARRCEQFADPIVRTTGFDWQTVATWPNWQGEDPEGCKVPPGQ